MKKRVKRFLSVFLSVSLFFSIFLEAFGNMENIFAEEKIIKEIQLDKENINHGEDFSAIVSFGGSGTKVYANQRGDINFSTYQAKVKLPSSPITLSSGGQVLGKVEFSDNKATLVFNEEAAKLDDIEGSFYFNIRGTYDGDMTQDGKGNIYIEYEGTRKTVGVDYRKGGGVTTSVYSKKGVEVSEDPTGNSVDWVFTFNAAKNESDGSASFFVTDNLPSTMTWDLEKINKNPYVVQFQGGYLATLFQNTGGWVNIQKAREVGIVIEFNGQNLSITIPEYANYGGGYTPTLNNTEVVVRLSSKITEETMNNEDIKYVENTSNPELRGADWKLDPTQFGDKVKINRQGGMISGTKPGELKIEKFIKGTQIPIKDVEFTLTRQDGQDIEVKENETYVNKGKSILLTTNDKGIANIKGLKPQSYSVKETKAPKWVEYNSENPIVKDFEMKSGDKVGVKFSIENEKKKINISVKKEWLSKDNQPLDGINTKVRLYRDDTPILEEVDLTKEKLNYTWSDLDFSDDQGKEYVYSVKEVGEENNKIELEGKTFKVSYTKNSNESFVITNKEQGELIPLVPSTIDVKVTKVWNGIESDKAPEVTVYLLKNGKKTDKSLKLNKENNWTGKFEKLPVVDNITDEKANEYKVEEEKISGYSTKITGDEKEGYVITNTKEIPLTPLVPSTIDVKVTKVWNGIESDKAPEVTVYLLKNGKKTDKSLKLNKENNWTGKFEKLPVVDNITDEKANEYKVEEEKVSGYSTKITGDEKEGYVITNTKDIPKSQDGSTIIDDKVDKIVVNRFLPQTGSGNDIYTYATILLISSLALFILDRKRYSEYF
ncbi:Cna B-type domain-containing protein [Peptostreptococcus canis]|uniref:Cna B-type domain-containing protein n=1 Tax=Peptostreptococcus canis TaxID=1159213 RepID=A0ABR6TMH5_9FIRM|nr:Cna B-type domain-containing protein [Peptostreptococcus canis]MBC2576614.1 Cna B-type domain-containing protein [Peptostreptococcus canis]MBP1998801.1 LPXTG-motif cell wall-anchored protein [Peptostreptococcus canis]